MDKNSPLRGPLLVLAGALCFSTSGLSQALAPEGATPPVVGALRMLLGGGFLFLWCAWRGALPRRKGWPLTYLMLASVSLFSCQIFFFKGMALAGVAVGTVVSLGFTPIAAALLGWAALGERPSRAWYPATLLAIAGLVLLNWNQTGKTDLAAVFVPLAAGLSYAGYLVFSKPLTRHHPPETVMMTLCLVSGLCLSPFLLFYPTAWIGTPQGAAVALNLGFTTSALAFSLTLAGVRTTPTATASTLCLAEPLSAALLGIFYLREPVTAASLVGLLCIFGSVVALIMPTSGKNEHQTGPHG